MNADVSIVIVSHGHELVLPDCLSSLRAALEGSTFEIVLVDNLGGGKLKAIAQSVGATLISNERPQGFAANVNRGVAATSGRHVLILNPDTRHARGRLASAIALLDDEPRVGVVGCTLLNEDGGRQQSFRRFPTLAVFLARGMGADRWPWRPRFYQRRMMEDVALTTPHPVDWIFGAFMLLRRRDLARLGGMDERFRLYYEDVDLCWRAREHGLETWVFPDVTFVHAHQRASAKSPFSETWRWHGRSAALYFWKTRGRAPSTPPGPLSHEPGG